jgi:hypothetical protein
MGSKVQGSPFKVDLTHLFLKLSCETTPKWHSFFIDQTGRFLASGGARVKLHCKSFFFDQTGRSRPEAPLV